MKAMRALALLPLLLIAGRPAENLHQAPQADSGLADDRRRFLRVFDPQVQFYPEGSRGCKRWGYGRQLVEAPGLGGRHAQPGDGAHRRSQASGGVLLFPYIEAQHKAVTGPRKDAGTGFVAAKQNLGNEVHTDALLQLIQRLAPYEPDLRT